MKFMRSLPLSLLALAMPAFASVSVTSPANNSTVSSPVTYTATASSTCASGVAAMGIYVNNQLAYKVNGSSINTSLTLSPGSYTTVVQEWDNCGAASTSPVNITVSGSGGPPASNGVTITAPTPGGSVASPVQFAATAGSSSCAKGVAAMGIYVGGALKYQVNGTSLSTALPFSGGAQTAVVQEWDNCGGSQNKSVSFTVGSSTATSVSITANPASISSGQSSTLSVTASNATAVTIAGSNGTSYTLSPSGGTQAVSPAATTTYTATATGSSGNATSSATVTVAAAGAATATLSASPSSIVAGAASTLSWGTTNATTISIAGSDGSSYPSLAASGTKSVTPTSNTTYTLTASGTGASATAVASVIVGSQSGLQAVQHVVFMLQENHSFDNYFGMLNPYRVANHWNIGDDGATYTVDGIDDKLTKTSNQDDEGDTFSLFKFKSTCVDDMTSSWLESYGDVSRYNFTPQRRIALDGFVHTGENYAKSCVAGKSCSGSFTDFQGKRSMGYYDQGFLNYYYYMASQFAVSDRWFSPISSKSIPNRVATFTGGTLQGLAFDPGKDDHLPQLQVNSIFQELDQSGVPWKIYYTVTQGSCSDPTDCPGGAAAQFPATNYGYVSYSYKYLYSKTTSAACIAPTQPSSVVGDASNSFCIDPHHIAPISTYYSDVANGTLPAFAFIEAGYGHNDEHPGSGQSILAGQQQVSSVVNSLMTSPSWSSSVFFLSYDEGGGPYDHVPPVPGHSNDYTDATLGSIARSSIPDISTVSVNADSYKPCVPSTPGTPTIHCDLKTSDPGANAGDAPAVQGFAAQLGFRVPNMVISPFTRKHYVSHAPMDHTAILKFVENRFIGPNAHLTGRDAVQPNLLDFFDFTGTPWATPPTPPSPITPANLGYDPCTPQTF